MRYFLVQYVAESIDRKRRVEGINRVKSETYPPESTMLKQTANSLISQYGGEFHIQFQIPVELSKADFEAFTS